MKYHEQNVDDNDHSFVGKHHLQIQACFSNPTNWFHQSFVEHTSSFFGILLSLSLTNKKSMLVLIHMIEVVILCLNWSILLTTVQYFHSFHYRIVRKWISMITALLNIRKQNLIFLPYTLMNYSDKVRKKVFFTSHLFPLLTFFNKTVIKNLLNFFITTVWYRPSVY